MPTELTVWRLIDGKPGHEKQTLGLAEALARRLPVARFDIACRGSLWNWLAGRFPAGTELPAPDLLIGAGKGCHADLLAARRVRGGKAVVLMRPSLPAALFDLCLIPAHDRPPLRANVLPTLGVLNAVRPAPGRRPGLGLILLGGVSEHYAWDGAAIAAQVADVVRASPDIAWRLTTSRRTPADMMARLEAVRPGNLALHPHEDTPPGWLEAALAESTQVWVSPDSVSMVYESLSSGAATGLLELAASRSGRVSSGIEQLISEHWVTPYSAWQGTRRLPAPASPLAEADRCADLIVARWFAGRA
jgi:mitochondrial fission protein ELM1